MAHRQTGRAVAARRARARVRPGRGGAELLPALGPVAARRWAWRPPSATTSTPTCSGCRSAFHDGWQSGQLLSRATTDLSVIRRFLSFGLIFLVINLVTFVTVVALLLHLYWPLGVAGRRSSAVPLFCDQPAVHPPVQRDRPADAGPAGRRGHAGRGDRRRHPGRSRRSAGATTWPTSSTTRARRLHDTAVGKTRMVAATWPRFDLVPNVTLGDRAGRRRGRGLGRTRSPSASWSRSSSLQLMLIWPIDALGFIIANGAGGDDRRRPDLRGARHRAVDRGPARARSRCDRRRCAARCASRASRFSYPGAAGRRCCAASTSRCSRARRWPSSAPPARGKTTLVSLVPRLIDVDRRPDHARRARHPRHHPGLAALGRRRRLRGGDAVLDERAGEPHPGPARRHRRGDRRGARDRPGRLRARPAVGADDPRRRAGPVALRRAAAAARAGPGGARQARGCWCSTTRCPRSTCTPRRWSRRRWPGCCAAPRRMLVVHRPSTVALADRVALLQDGVIAAVGTHSRAAGHRAGVPRRCSRPRPTRATTAACWRSDWSHA